MIMLKSVVKTLASKYPQEPGNFWGTLKGLKSEYNLTLLFTESFYSE